MMCNCHLQYSNVPLSCPTVGRGRTCRTSQCAAPAASLVDLEPFSELAPKVAPLRLGARALPGCLRAGGHCVGRGARRRIVRAVQLEREARAAATPPAGGPRRLAARRCHPGWRPCVLARVSRWHDRPAVGPTVAGLALLLPYSAIQLRMARRSFRAEILARMERTVASRPVLPVLLLRRTSATRSVAPHRRAA